MASGFIIHCTHKSLNSDFRITVAGTKEGINMVEGCTNEISEEEMVDVFFKAHDHH